MAENVNPVFEADSVYQVINPTPNQGFSFPQREKEGDAKYETKLLNVLKALISALLLSAAVIFGGLISVPFLMNGNSVSSTTAKSSSITPQDSTTTSQLLKDILLLKEEIQILKQSNLSQSYALSKQQIMIENLKNDLSTEKQLRVVLEKELKSVKNITEQSKKDFSQFSSSILASIEKQALQISNLNATSKQLSKLNTISSTSSSSSTTPPEYCTTNIPVSVCHPCLCSALPFMNGKNIYTCDCRNLPSRQDCKDYYDTGYRLNGIYTMRPDGKRNITAYCDQIDDGGGWVVIQRRFDASTGFNRGWNEYKDGFGNISREYYLGNENIHILTKIGSELKIDIENFNKQSKFSKFTSFSIKDEDEGYKSSVTGYSGTAGNNFINTNGYKFSTWDKDNDVLSYNCAALYFGGWWFSRNCIASDYLNGVYFPTTATCPTYSAFTHGGIRLVKSVMKIRRKL